VFTRKTDLMFSIVIGEYSLVCHERGLPQLYEHYVRHARLADEFDQEGDQGGKCVLAVKKGFDWPFLIVTQRCRLPGIFDPSALLVPETKLIFIGAGERLLAYNLEDPRRLWQDTTDCGMLGWARYGEHIIMSAELELAVWDIYGQKRWTTFVEPPWEYRVSEGIVYLNVMGRLTSFPLDTGPSRLPR
jgi:hypothetical protein